MSGETPIDLDKGAGHHIDPSLIPEPLRALIPLVEVWAFESLEDQDAFASAMLRERPDAVKAFNAAVDARREEFRHWKLFAEKKHKSEYTDEDWRHPYWLFLRALKVREITGDEDPLPQDVLDARASFQAELRKEEFASAGIKADAAFRLGDYAQYIRLMSPFEDLLTPAQKVKIGVARKKTA